MSRHRAVRNIDLDEELAEDDFDTEDNPYEDISEEDHIQLEDALVQLVGLIGTPGDESGFTEREMKDALWNSYFDVDQALNSLVEERSKRESKEKKKAGELAASIVVEEGVVSLFSCLSPSLSFLCVLGYGGIERRCTCTAKRREMCREKGDPPFLRGSFPLLCSSFLFTDLFLSLLLELIDELDDPTLSALQRLSLQRKGVRLDGNPNVAKGIQGLHFGGRAGLAKKNLASLAPDGLPGTGARKDSWNGFENLDVDKLQAAKSNKRPADGHEEGSGSSLSGSTPRPSKLAALAAAKSSSSKPPTSATVLQASAAEGKPLSKLQQKMQANLLARQQKKHTLLSKEEEALLKQKEEEEERNLLLHMPNGDAIASLFPVALVDSKQSAAPESSFGCLLRATESDDLAVPGGSPFQGASHLEAFSKPSPDDVVLNAREGTNLAKT